MAARRPSPRAELARLGRLGDAAGLAETALALSALHGRPGEGGRLDQLAAGLEGINAAEARARALTGRLGRFHPCGDDEAPPFADLLEHGRGSPAALAVLWLEVARRAGWAAEALDFPTLAPVRLTDAHGHRAVVDPASGQLLAAPDLRALLKGVEGAAAELRPAHFAALGNRAILLRLGNELKTRALLAGRVAEALTTVEGLLAFAPDQEALWREAGMMHLRLDDLAAAIAALEQFASRTANGAARRRTQQLLQDLRARQH